MNIDETMSALYTTEYTINRLDFISGFAHATLEYVDKYKDIPNIDTLCKELKLFTVTLATAIFTTGFEKKISPKSAMEDYYIPYIEMRTDDFPYGVKETYADLMIHIISSADYEIFSIYKRLKESF